MVQFKRSLKISLLLTATLALANCGKKEFNSATNSSETAKGDVTPTNPGQPGTPDPGLPTIPPRETPSNNDVLVAIFPVSELFQVGGAAPSLADLGTTKTPLMKLAQNAVLGQYGSFLGCEPTYDVYRVKFDRFSGLLDGDLQTWLAGIKQNSTLVGHHDADFYCNKLELGEDF